MYDKYIKIDKKFKSSVNLQYDLNNEEKILQYVPTTDLCDVIKTYIKMVLFGESNRSTLLAGPYGKGKSYIMLIISYLFSKRNNREVFDELKNRIAAVDEELAFYINKLDQEKISLLPVIINNNDSDDINQNFMLALRRSLTSFGLEDVIPNSVFSECLDQIALWENNADLNLINICEEKLKINLQRLKMGLKDYNREAYVQFLGLFECVNHGYKFNALVGNDISTIYMSVAKSIQEFGYNGLFVIFDEFGVFLESKSNDFALKLNKIQTFAERCNSSSKENQMYFCCITHKDIALYQSDKTYSDDFEKISGRFKQIRFDRSLDENYQILCNALEKGVGYDGLVQAYQNENEWLYNMIRESGIFSSDFLLQYVVNNGFPFNPIALYVLIQVSEKIAQNERTLFTFISDSDLYSFRYFITNNSAGLLNVDYVYNYFQGLIKNSSEYKSLYYNVESLSKIDLKKEHHDIFKCIALMKILNDEIKYSATVKNIALSLDVLETQIEAAISQLISNNILKKSVADGTIDFDVLADNEINKLIDQIITSKISYESESSLLSKFDTDRYIISNKYNFEFSMTRYFYTVYLKSSELRNLRSFNLLINEAKSDGVVINLINDDDISVAEIRDILDANQTEDVYRIVVRLSDAKISNEVFQKLRRIYAAQTILEGKYGLGEAADETLKSSIADMSSEIRNYLKEYHSKSICINKSNYSVCSLKDVTYNSLVKSFPLTVVMNNEQVNKNLISAVTTKARNNVIDVILGNYDLQYGATSAEGTILASFEDAIKNREDVIIALQNIIMSSNNRLCAADIVSYLGEYPYGMRKGIIPLFIAKVVSMMTVFEKNNVQTVLLYNDTLQIKMDAANLTKLMLNPSRYYFSFRRINKERIYFIESLASNLKIKITHNFNSDAELVVKGLRSYVSNLEPVIVKSSKSDNLLELNDDELEFKNLFLRHDLSTFDILCDGLNRFGENSAEILGRILLIKNAYREKVSRLYEDTILRLKNILSGLSEESIKTNYIKWKNDNPIIINIIFDDDFKKIFNTLEIAQYNDFDVVDKLSFSILNCTLNDWNQKCCEQFFATFENFVNYVANYSEDDAVAKNDMDISLETRSLSRLGTTLYSNLQEILAEYGSSISNSEKVDILKRLLKDILD